MVLMSDSEALGAMLMATLMSIGAALIAGVIASDLLIGVGVGIFSWPLWCVFVARI
jgi:hypothetical protein